ncbi:MAG: polysaccharide deacetylase family protein [Hyphomicrobiaceae bacterium]
MKFVRRRPGLRLPSCLWPLAAAIAFGTCALAAAPSRAQTLLEQCWAADALASRPDEKPPRHGAPGHAQRIPKVALQPFKPIAPALHGSIRRVVLPPGKKLIALTFDLCEQPGEIAGYDGAIVDYLRANNIRATFFAGGKWLLTHDERSQQLMADGRFEIGSHGWAHRNVRGLSGQALASELIGPQAAYEAVRARLAQRQCVAGGVLPGAPRIRLFRFPYGACNPAALAATAENGLHAIQWDVSTGDPSPGQSAKAIAAAVMRHVRPGSIVLMHANGRGHHTSEALPLVIPKLRAKGYQFVTVSELLAAGRPEVAPTCYDAKPGDTDKYDRLFAFHTEVHRARSPKENGVPR